MKGCVGKKGNKNVKQQRFIVRNTCRAGTFLRCVLSNINDQNLLKSYNDYEKTFL